MPARLQRLLAASLLTLFASAAPLAAEALASLLERSSYNRSEQFAIESVFQRAARQAVPRELLTPRLSEAIAKSVPGDRTVNALEAELSSLLNARELLLSVPYGSRLAAQRQLWQRTATLIRAGIAPDDLRPLATAAADRPDAYRAATTLLLSVYNWGLDSALAAQLAAAALESPLPETEFAAVMEILIEARRLRLSPEIVAESVIGEIGTVTTAAQLRQRTLY